MREHRTPLTDELLAAIHERAPVHDAENTFPDQDLAGSQPPGTCGPSCRSASVAPD